MTFLGYPTTAPTAPKGRRRTDTETADAPVTPFTLTIGRGIRVWREGK
jgi:hypothetical protein